MKLGIVLAAGAALGAAHVGVLRRLAEENIHPDIIVGTSAGALVGGIYASGNLDKFEEIVKDKSIQKALWDFNSPTSKGTESGIIAGDKFLNLLRELTDNKNFEDLDKRLAFNAVDLNTHEHVILNKGNIAEAIRASTSVPILFKPFKLNGRVLIDGAIIDQMPVELANSMGADIVIAVNFMKESVEEEIIKLENFITYKYKINRIGPATVEDMIQQFPYVAKYLLNNPIGRKIFKYFEADLGNANKILSLLKNSLRDVNYKNPDITIAPDVTMFQSGNIHKLQDIFDAGYNKTDELIEDIKCTLKIMGYN